VWGGGNARFVGECQIFSSLPLSAVGQYETFQADTQPIGMERASYPMTCKLARQVICDVKIWTYFYTFNVLLEKNKFYEEAPEDKKIAKMLLRNMCSWDTVVQIPFWASGC
jgi:hypothetical protein